MAIDIVRFAHCNVNCTDLERSRRFYTELVGLEAQGRTNPPPQDCRAFGLEGDGQWDAFMMVDGRGQGAAPAVDLLEWKLPRPVGTPYQPANHLGMFRVCFMTPDIDATYAKALELGAEMLSPPQTVVLSADGSVSVRALFVRDPDGTLVEFVEQKDAPVRFIHVHADP